MQSSPLPCYLIPLGPKYLPQHSILAWLRTSFHNPEFVIKDSVLSVGWKDWDNICSCNGGLNGLKINVSVLWHHFLYRVAICLSV
jgi:hypothetical protein